MTGHHRPLTDQAFLVTYRQDHATFPTTQPVRFTVRAAALVELWLGRQLTDRDGKAVVTGAPARDPLLVQVLDQVAASRPRSWQHWVTKEAAATHRQVRDRLAGQRLVRVETGRVLGLFARDVATMPDPRAARELVDACRHVALGSTPVHQVPVPLAALVGLAWVAELDSVLRGSERREHRDRIGRLAEQAGPAGVALRKAVVALQASA